MNKSNRFGPLAVTLGACLGASSTALGQINLFDTGPPRPVHFDATNMGNFDPDGDGMLNTTFLGFSAGNLSATQPQRWAAMPFTLPVGSWTIMSIDVDGFIPAGAVATQMGIRIWSRTGQAAPVAADLLQLQTIPMPVAMDDLELDADGNGNPADGDDTFLRQLDVADFVLGGGDYYLTIYGADPGPVPPAQNFAWITNADNGINFKDGAGVPFFYRSSAFPAPGFLVTQLAATNLMQQAGLDPNDIYTQSFTIYGKIPAPPALALLGLGALMGRRRRR